MHVVLVSNPQNNGKDHGLVYRWIKKFSNSLMRCCLLRIKSDKQLHRECYIVVLCHFPHIDQCIAHPAQGSVDANARHF